MLEYSSTLNYPLYGENGLTSAYSTTVNSSTSFYFVGNTNIQENFYTFASTVGGYTSNNNHYAQYAQFGSTTSSNINGSLNTASSSSVGAFNTSSANSPATSQSATTNESSFVGTTNITTTQSSSYYIPVSTTYSTINSFGSSTLSSSGYTSSSTYISYSLTRLTTTTYNATSFFATYNQSYTYYDFPAVAAVFQCDNLLEIIWAVNTPEINFLTSIGSTYQTYTAMPQEKTYIVNVQAFLQSTNTVSAIVGGNINSFSYSYSTFATYSSSGSTEYQTSSYTFSVINLDTNYLPAKTLTSYVATTTNYVTTSSSFSVNGISTTSFFANGTPATTTQEAVYETSYSFSSFVNLGTTTSFVGTVELTNSICTITVGATATYLSPGESYTNTYISYSTPLTGYEIVYYSNNITVHYQVFTQTCFLLPQSNLNFSSDSIYLNLSANSTIYYPFYSKVENQYNPVGLFVPIVYPGTFSALESSTTATSQTNTSFTTWIYSWSSNALYYSSRNSSTFSTGSINVQGGSNAALSQVASYSSFQTSVFGGLIPPENQTFTIEIGAGLYKVSFTHGTSTGTNTLNVPIYTTTTAASSDNFAISGEAYVTTAIYPGVLYLTSYSNTISLQE